MLRKGGFDDFVADVRIHFLEQGWGEGGRDAFTDDLILFVPNEALAELFPSHKQGSTNHTFTFPTLALRKTFFTNGLVIETILHALRSALYAQLQYLLRWTWMLPILLSCIPNYPILLTTPHSHMLKTPKPSSSP